MLGNFGNAHSFPHFAVAQTRLLWTGAVNAVLISRLRMRCAVAYRLRGGKRTRLATTAADRYMSVKRQNFGERSHLSHTPVTILTGFLGSGKTTLLNRALRDPAMANTAVVINEFGEIGLDHALAAQSDDTIMVLENGCLCCTVFGDLVTTLNNLYHAREAGEIPRFDHVVIETSGLADPSPLIQAFLSDPVLAGLFRIGIVVATVDAVNGEGTLDNHVKSVRQVALADHILITKLDLVDPARVAETEAALTARLRRLNPAADFAHRRPRLRHRFIGSDGFDPADAKADAVPGSMSPYTKRPMRTIITIMRMTAPNDHEDHDHHHRDDRESSLSVSRVTSRYRAMRCGSCSTRSRKTWTESVARKRHCQCRGRAHRPAVIQGAQHLLHNMAWLDRWPDADAAAKSSSSPRTSTATK